MTAARWIRVFFIFSIFGRIRSQFAQEKRQKLKNQKMIEIQSDRRTTQHDGKAILAKIDDTPSILCVRMKKLYKLRDHETRNNNKMK